MRLREAFSIISFISICFTALFFYTYSSLLLVFLIPTFFIYSKKYTRRFLIDESTIPRSFLIGELYYFV